MTFSRSSRESVSALFLIPSRISWSSLGGANRSRSGAVRAPSPSAASRANRSTASVYVWRIPRGTKSGQMMLNSCASFTDRTARRCSASAWSWLYWTARSWSGPTLATRSFDCPSTTCPNRPTATSSRDVPTNAISSFVRTLTGTRATALTSGSPIRQRPSRATRDSCCSAKISDFQDGGPTDHVRDQPLPVDPGHVEVGCGGGRDFLGINIDVMALEVQRAPVAVDRDLKLVRGVIRTPMVLRREGRGLRQPESSDLVEPGRGRSGTHRHRRVGREQAHHQVDVLRRHRTVEVLLDLIDLPVVGLHPCLIGCRVRRLVPAGHETEDDNRHDPADDQLPHLGSLPQHSFRVGTRVQGLNLRRTGIRG